MRALALAALLGGCAGAEIQTGSPKPEPRWATDTGTAWRALTTNLPGRWTATTPQNRTITVSYRLISNGSAILETFTSSSGKETATVYHPDGRGLMLTHYCAQGNQARLRATTATSQTVIFELEGATNLAADQDVMERLVVTFGEGAFELQSDYKSPSDGKVESSTLHFVRAAE